jgi:hypothetical protein
MSDDGDFWRRCNTCKTAIAFRSPYYVCNVSTCNRPGTSFVFCSIACWDAHVPLFRHRESWAEERIAPALSEVPVGERPVSSGSSPQRAEAQSIPASEDVFNGKCLSLRRSSRPTFGHARG